MKRLSLIASALAVLGLTACEKGLVEDIAVIAGGVIPAQDYDFLYKAGVAAIFGPGTSVAKAAVEMMKILLDK